MPNGKLSKDVYLQRINQ